MGHVGRRSRRVWEQLASQRATRQRRDCTRDRPKLFRRKGWPIPESFPGQTLKRSIAYHDEVYASFSNKDFLLPLSSLSFDQDAVPNAKRKSATSSRQIPPWYPSPQFAASPTRSGELSYLISVASRSRRKPDPRSDPRFDSLSAVSFITHSESAGERGLENSAPPHGTSLLQIRKGGGGFWLGDAQARTLSLWVQMAAYKKDYRSAFPIIAEGIGFTAFLVRRSVLRGLALLLCRED